MSSCTAVNLMNRIPAFELHKYSTQKTLCRHVLTWLLNKFRNTEKVDLHV